MTMDLKELIARTRTYRRFDESTTIDRGLLTDLIDLARLAGSARNCQPWQYMVVNDPAGCRTIFPHIGWAAYLADWKGPEPGEQPMAYILCLLNRDWLKGAEKEAHFDLGIASQNLLLGAMAQGIGGCRIGAFSPKLASLLAIPGNLSLELLIALGKPGETVIIEEARGDIRYWHGENNTHHVPKRRLDEILVDLEWK